MLMYWLIFALFAVAALFHRRLVPVPAGTQAAAPANIRTPSMGLALAAIFLVIVIGLRFQVGGDWANYRAIYNDIARMNLPQVLAYPRAEPGYALLNWISSALGTGIWPVNVICAAIFTAGLMRIAKQQPNAWLALLVATPFLIIVVAMAFTRQAAALGCLMLGIAALIEQKSLRKFLLYVLIGAAFHRTVLVFAPVILLAGTKSRGAGIALAIVAALFGYFFVLQGAGRYEAGYIRSNLDAAGATVRVLMNVVPAVLLIVLGDRMYASREEKIVWKTFAVLALISGVGLLAVQSSAIVDRLAMYLIPLQLFVFSRLPFVLSPSGSAAVPWRFLIVLYSALVLFVWLNYAVNAHSWLPYRNYLLGA